MKAYLIDTKNGVIGVRKKGKMSPITITIDDILTLLIWVMILLIIIRKSMRQM